MLLKKLRTIKKFRQYDVAIALGISVRQYQRIEAGESFLTQSKLNKLEDLFGLPQRVLLAKSVEEVPDFYKPYLSKLEKCKI